MNALFKSAGVLVAATVATALPATAATGSPLSADNACPNPVLAQNATGWAVTFGGNGSRVAVADHSTAELAFQIATNSPAAMHQTIQLDWFPTGATSTRPSAMNVAWMRYYSL